MLQLTGSAVQINSPQTVDVLVSSAERFRAASEVPTTVSEQTTAAGLSQDVLRGD